MGIKRIDLIGQKFNRLTAIEFSHMDKWRGTHWLCKCDCGNEKIISGRNLKYGRVKSCGCLREESNKKRTLPEGVAARNAAIYYHKNNAKERNLEQALSDEQIIAIHKENCHYCGTPPLNISSQLRVNGSYVYNGIDRLNNEKGYTLDNVVPCCRRCNRAKSDQTYDEFMNWLKRIHSHSKLNKSA